MGNVILQQLGGSRFVAMTGARNFVDVGNGLMFALPARFAQNKANKVRVILGELDLYTMEFWYVRGADMRKISEHDMLYADQLQRTFTEQTGLDTRL